MTRTGCWYGFLQRKKAKRRRKVKVPEDHVDDYYGIDSSRLDREYDSTPSDFKLDPFVW